MKDKLSPTAKKLYQFIYDYHSEHGFPPSYQEMMDNHSSLNSKAAVSHQINNLVQAGWIEKTPHISRAIRLKRYYQPPPTMTRIPVVGVIQAGAPIPVPASDFAVFSDETVDIGEILPNNLRKKSLFALKVQGNSMIDSNIQDGDVVVMEPVTEVNNGDMTAIWLPVAEETTLKHFYREKDRVRLQPANPTMPPIYKKPHEVEVQGRVIMVMRACF